MAIENATEPPFGSVGRPVNKLLDQVQKGYFNFFPTDTWTPNVNLYETDNTYLVCVDLAGVDKEKIDVAVDGSRLTIAGSRHVPTDADGTGGDLHNKRVKVHLMEIDHGSFSREVELPEDVIQQSINANYRNGLLWIELPRKK